MHEVNVSELLSRLQEYLALAEVGEEILVIRRGKVVARLSAARGVRSNARDRLVALRATAQVGDVVSPLGVDWNAAT